ncbi:MAG: hypothetical protein EOO50_04395 [Flavobacterium sp.]|uniref:YncE family protein n=1 Tax=Flavobacterium sp. TaxID=239 RepID=UPI00121DDAE7|nr:DUF5074 domain-containing protein [Flavobacterium sp.]RZJ67822.1 MAG: hypothetical protein EOO50_04395 [Flavobacterium sp.]
MKLNKLFLSAIAGSLLFVSCKSDDDNSVVLPLGNYDNGVLVLNEGGIGTVTYVNNDLTTTQQDIFAVVNGDANDLGAYAQSMFFDGDRAFIISNGSNKITVVNRYTFEYIGAITTGLTVPRYGVVFDGKAYVTNSNTFGSDTNPTGFTDDFIAVIDLGSLALEDPIAVNNQAERLVVNNGKLYVSGGFYGSGTDLTVIDAATKSVVSTITVGESPNSLEVDNGVLYVLCSGYTGPSKIVKVSLSTDTVTSEVPFAISMGNAQNLDIESGKLYFTVGPKIYEFNTTTTSVIDTPFISTGSTSNYIGYGFAVNDGKIYISEAADDFSSDGRILVYSTGTAQLADLAVGLGPNGFYFN